MKENEWIVHIDKYECVLGAYHCHKKKKKVLLALVSKRASEESSSEKYHHYLVLESRGPLVSCPLQEEEKHLG